MNLTQAAINTERRIHKWNRSLENWMNFER